MRRLIKNLDKQVQRKTGPIVIVFTDGQNWNVKLQRIDEPEGKEFEIYAILNANHNVEQQVSSCKDIAELQIVADQKDWNLTILPVETMEDIWSDCR